MYLIDSDKKPCSPISPIHMTKLLKEINESKAAGPDGIPNMVLKRCAENITPALCIIFQKSLDSGDQGTIGRYLSPQWHANCSNT